MKNKIQRMNQIISYLIKILKILMIYILEII